MRFEAHLDRFLSAYGDRLPSDLGGALPALGPGVGAAARMLDNGARALTHGDLHLDNVIFAAPAPLSSSTGSPDELAGRERAFHDAALADGRLAAAFADYGAPAVVADR